MSKIIDFFSNKKAYSLMEVMLVVTVISLVAVPLAVFFADVTFVSAESKKHSQAISLARRVMEDVNRSAIRLGDQKDGQGTAINLKNKWNTDSWRNDYSDFNSSWDDYEIVLKIDDIRDSNSLWYVKVTVNWSQESGKAKEVLLDTVLSSRG